jgi:hypothetical protein
VAEERRPVSPAQAEALADRLWMERGGFVFFHYQCTEHAAAGHRLSLYYGGFDGAEDTTTAVGRRVVTALERAGLPTRWDGNPGTAIEVTPLDWRKRLVG